ncbi:MAG: NAD(P)/FAD-dependent oxidoreductase [Polyangiaceae bacterium]|nr:NAD(P)/FAD-dependent oxidoreductase [Polyangiaceae bacterium]
MKGRSFDYDVAIIGGGPAGASTALHLVRAEGIAPNRIVVLDKARFPRDKPCAGAISPLGIGTLEAMGIAVDVPRVTLAGARVIAESGAGETLAPMGIVVCRREFDAWLLETARHDGVVVRDGDGVTGIARIADGYRLMTASGAVQSRFVAICDGSGSTSRKLLGLRESARKGHLYVLESPEVPSDIAAGRKLAEFDLRVVGDGIQGYYWDFPTAQGGMVPLVSRGIYHANLSSNRAVKASLARALDQRGIDIAHVKLKAFSTRPFVRSSVLAIDGAILVGEAAGINRATGEGIAPAIVMAKIAARHIARAVRTGSSARFEVYSRDVLSSCIGRHMLQSAALTRFVYGAIGTVGVVARRYLVRSPYGRAAALKWYCGEPLSLFTQIRLGAGLMAATHIRRGVWPYAPTRTAR